jgi:TonB family protein
MRKTLAALALAIASATLCLGQTNADAAQKEVNLGSRAYRAGRYAEAERHFRRALELDPDGKGLRLFIARAARRQFNPDNTSPENTAAGERAAAAYQDILKADPANDDAYRAVVFLYERMRNEQKVRELALGRANDFSLPNERRAEAFVTLASKQWRCSRGVTEREENRTTEQQQPDKILTKYKMPADQGDFIKARQCVADGLQLAEQATSLAPNNRDGWAYKVNLLREAAKLAEMEGDAAQKAGYERLLAEAVERLDGFSAVTLPLPIEADDVGAPADAAARRDVAAAPKKTVVNGGVLNGKAVSKPQPAYPEEAKRAGAQGTVTVYVLVDEGGNVIEATAVSGHELLHEAAAAAARRARFSPTLLSGRPVKVNGHVTYNFVLR